MYGKKWPEVWSKSIAIDFAAGLGIAEIASRLNEKFGCNLDNKTVYKRLWRMGLTPPAKDSVWTEERKTHVVTLYNSPSAPSFTQMATAVNEKFGTDFTRNAMVSIAKRLGLTGKAVASAALRYNPDGSIKPARGRQPRKPRVRKPQERVQRQSHPDRPPIEEVRLRCVELSPMHVQFLDLEPHHCRFPYGDGPFSFCGHQKAKGSNYCTPHYHLSLKPPAERAIGAAPSKNWRAA